MHFGVECPLKVPSTGGVRMGSRKAGVPMPIAIILNTHPCRVRTLAYERGDFRHPWQMSEASRDLLDHLAGMGYSLGTGTAVMLFCGLPSISLSE